jgi:predicted glycosyltransferase
MRVMLFSHEGYGLGHVARTAKAANILCGAHTCLVVTCQREVSWLLDPACDFVKLPSFDHCFKDRSEHREVQSAAFTHIEDPRGFLSSQAKGLVSAFEPDLILVDHIPSGTRGYLYETIAGTACRKALLMRPVLGNLEESMKHIFANGGEDLLRDHYHGIFVACPLTVRSEVEDVSWPIRLSKVGFLDHCISEEERMKVRLHRGVPDSGKWVVCSNGSGQHATPEFAAIASVAHLLPENLYLDLILGPKYRGEVNVPLGGNRVTVHRSVPNLGLYHQAADVILTHGGSNSLSEGLAAGANIGVYASFRENPNAGEVEKYLFALNDVEGVSVLPEQPELLAAEILRLANFSRRPRKWATSTLVSDVERLFHEA